MGDSDLYIYGPILPVTLDRLLNMDLPLQVVISLVRFCCQVRAIVICAAPLCVFAAFHILL